MENSPNDSDSSDDICIDKFEKLDRNSTSRSLNYGVELSPEDKHLPSSTTVKVFYQLSDKPQMPPLQAPNIYQVDKTSSITDDCFYSRDLVNVTDSLLTENSPISIQQNQTTTSLSDLEDPVNNKEKTTKDDRSPFAASRNEDFASPPERGSIPVIRSLAKNSKATITPSPEKRSVETDAESTPIKKSKKTPESDLGKLGIESESYTSKLRHSAPARTSCKFFTNLRAQQMNEAIQHNKDWKSVNTLSTPSKRKRTTSSAEPTASNLSSVISPPPVGNIIYKSPTILQIHDGKDDEFSVERKTLSFRECSTDSNAAVDVTNPDNLTQIVCLVPFPMKKHESTYSNEITDVGFADPNLGTRKQTKIPSVSDTSNFNTMHLKTLTDTTLLRSNVSGKQRDTLPVTDVSSEVAQYDLSAKKSESAVRPVELTDRNSNYCVSSESFEAQYSETKIEPSSNMVDSAIELQTSKSSKSSPIISNPFLPSSCHLPRGLFSSISNIPRRILEFDISDAKVNMNQIQSDSSTPTSAPDIKISSQSKEHSVSNNRGMHQRSLSDQTAVSKNLKKLEHSNTGQEMLPRSYSKEPSTSCNFQMHRRSVSAENLKPRTEHKVQQDPSNSESKISTVPPSIVRPLFRDTSKASSSDMTSEMINSMKFSDVYSFHQFFTKVTETVRSNERSRNNPKVQVQPNRKTQLQEEMHSRFLSGDASTSRNQPEGPNAATSPYIDVFKGQASTSNYQPIVPTSSSLYQASASGNNPKVQMQPKRNTPLLQELRARLISGDASISRNRPEAANAVTPPPYIGVFEGEASTSNYQPIVSTSSSFDQASAPRNLPEVSSNIKPPNMDVSTSNCQPTATNGPSDHLRDSSSVSSNSSDVSQQSHSRLRGMPNPLIASRVGEALLHLRYIMRDMLLHNGENLLWEDFDPLFSNIFVSCTEIDRNKLSTKLLRYLVDSSHDMMSEILIQEPTAAPARLVYEQLMSTVVSTIVLILIDTNSSDINSFLRHYFNLQNEKLNFPSYFSDFNIERIQDEVSRIQVKRFKKIFMKFLLRTSIAFELLLMHLGENCPTELREFYLNSLPEEAKQFFKNEF